MNIYALLLLCASAISVSLGISVYFLNRKSPVNKIFLLLMSANTYWAFCTFMIATATTVDTALLWQKILVFWPLVVAFILHFSLEFTESDLLKNKLIYPVVYLPALAFSLIDLTTNWISSSPTLNQWGYTAGIQLSAVSQIDGIWAAVVSLASLLLFINYYNRVTDPTRKQQTKFVAVGFAIPVFISLLTDSIFPVMGISFPVLGSITGTFMSLMVVYAMIRYNLFSFTPEIAAENIFLSMADAVILVDTQGKIVKVNPAAVETSGFSEKELVGRLIGSLVHRVNIFGPFKTFEKFLAELRTKRGITNFAITFPSKSGKQRFAKASFSVVSDSRGNEIGLAIVLHDVTETMEMEQKLLKAERLASIGELAGILGHDLRNPLNAIRTGTYYLKTKYAGSLDDKDSLIFESIEQSIDYSDKIVTDLIEYSSEIKLKAEDTTAKSLVANALATAAPPMNVRVIDETQETPRLQVDTASIRRAFTNIIKNAYDAMPNGGVLTVKSHEEGGKVFFNFIDTGAGMTQETLGRIWTPLFTTKAKGMGFGLSISKRIVEAHNGKIMAQSQPGVGTNIQIALPINFQGQSQQSIG